MCGPVTHCKILNGDQFWADPGWPVHPFHSQWLSAKYLFCVWLEKSDFTLYFYQNLIRSATISRVFTQTWTLGSSLQGVSPALQWITSIYDGDSIYKQILEEYNAWDTTDFYRINISVTVHRSTKKSQFLGCRLGLQRDSSDPTKGTLSWNYSDSNHPYNIHSCRRPFLSLSGTTIFTHYCKNVLHWFIK